METHKDKIRLLCVDDQPIIGEAIHRALSGAKQIEFYYCQEPGRVLDLVKRIKPSVILQDLVMPEIDGLELLKRLRATPEGAQVPVIMLSAKEEPSIKAEAFALGASDYMVKVPATAELLARVNYHAQAYRAQQERDAVYQSLLEQLQQAANYVRSLLPRQKKSPIHTEWVFQPSANLGGDAFDCFFIGDEYCVFYLLDVCDHGVGPALLSVSVMNLLRSSALYTTALTSPKDVLTTLNARFPMDTQDGKFFTIWYGTYHLPSRQLTYACAGHPPALLLAPGAPTQRLRTDSIAIGITDTVPFIEAQCTLQPGSALYLFSDGVYELFQDDKPLGLDDFEREVAQLHKESPTTPLATLVQRMQTLQGHANFEDDFSLLRLIF